MNVFLTVPCIWICGFLGAYTPALGQMPDAVSPAEGAPVNIYLLRGIGRESGHWGQTFLKQMSAHFPEAHLVLMDLPGAGSLYQENALISIEQMADFLHNRYADSLKQLPGKQVLMATSLAGNVALDWVVRYPEDFDGVAMVGATFKGFCPSYKRVQPEAKKLFFEIFFTANIIRREQKFIEINTNRFSDSDSLLLAWVQIQRQHPVTQGTLLKQTLAGMKYHPPKTKPSIPVLIVGSEGDKIPEADCIRAVATHLGGQLAMHPTAGHAIPIDAPCWLSDTFAHWIITTVMNPNYTTNPASPRPDTGHGLLDFHWAKEGLHSIMEFTSSAAEGSLAFFRR